MPGAIFLEGEKVNLRTVEEEDLEFIRNTYNHPEVRNSINSRKPANLEQEKEFFKDTVSNDESTQLLICSEEEPVGLISLSPKNEPRVAEIGLWLHPEHHGNGYGTEASRLMIDYGFKETTYHRIYARVYESNKASQHIWEKIGFQKEGELREQIYRNGEFEDTYIYGILENEWRN